MVFYWFVIIEKPKETRTCEESRVLQKIASGTRMGGKAHALLIDTGRSRQGLL